MNQAESVLFTIVLASAMIVSLKWVAREARKRRSSFSIVILCFLAWPFGILVWLLARPGYYLPGVPAENAQQDA